MIQGGSPLSGEIVAAGNKNAALPILAACLLTEEERGAPQRAADPRHRDPDQPARAARRQGRVDGRQRAAAARRRAQRRRGRRGGSRRGSGPRSCSPGRCSRASARRGCRRRAATSSAAAASIRTSTPSATSAPRSSGDRWLEITAPPGRPQAMRDLHGRALGDGDRERAARRGADARARRRSPTPPASPTSRTSRGCSTRWAREIDGIGSNVMTVHGRDRLGGAEHDICPDHIEVASFMALAAATGGELRDPRRRARGPGHDPPPLPPPRPAVDGRGPRHPRAARAAARRSATTSATRSRRSTTGPGRPSPPT